MLVAVIHESRTGTTRQAAHHIADSLGRLGVESSVSPARNPDLSAVAAADLVMVGTWTDGLFFFGQRPGGAARLRALPPLWNTPVATFCTYAINPGSTANKLAKMMRDAGADPVATASFHRKRLPEGVDDFVDAALASAGLVPA